MRHVLPTLWRAAAVAFQGHFKPLQQFCLYRPALTNAHRLHLRLCSEKASAASSAHPSAATYPVGMQPDPEAATKLLQVYDQTLRTLETLPADSVYRQNVEVVTRHRRGIVASAVDDRAAIERRIGVGHLEEVLEMARDELELVAHMKQWQPWQQSQDKAVPLQVLD
ncbi:hypothetical protein CDCA_CDCA01G0374 [Cyanidium caldarium]|uniref:Uncharacterized protein n=1 Tax=Cyanidium caldarium TaxID=2771 RepID=A0AAV9IQF0_CYACA|nr:hypothetical protein CDCA_CDCA01G0374 [Cyanidium caldarium]